VAEPTPPDPPRGRRRWRWVLGALLLGALGVFLARRPLLEAVPPLLVVADPDEPADAIVVLAGDQGERVEQAVLLWKKGLSRTGLLLCSGGRVYHATTWAALMAAHAEELGVPREKIVLQDRSRTTVEDARFSFEVLKARGVSSIVLVTSAWHSRRAKRTFEREAPGLHVVSCPAPPPAIEGDWWHDAEATRAVVTELLKYLW
jgi:uncharacterized SAM-binding protein YcdF (DUF218 family)